MAIFSNLKNYIKVEKGDYTKVADYNGKEYLKAKTRVAVKNLLSKAIDGKASYTEIEQLSIDVINYAEIVHTLQSTRTTNSV